jgi:hypothetical protein
MMTSDYAVVFMEYIQKHAPRYYPGFGTNQVSVQLLHKEERARAVLYRFKLSNEAQVRSVFVKVPLPEVPESQPGDTMYEKPLLFPKTEPKDMHWLQYTALKTIYEYFTSLNKTQLGAIRVLDYLPQYEAVLMEESSDPRLRQLVLKENRFSSPFMSGELSVVFRNVGTWLRIYHTMPKEADVNVRHPCREDYIEAIEQLSDFLAKTLGEKATLRKATKAIIEKAEKLLPEVLPLGLGHGDYAMRNILVGQNARVTVLDTFSRWRTPIYEDIGYFLNELKTSYPQLISQGLAFRSDQLSAYEQAFLEGYFEKEPIPYGAIRLYEILALLDRWSSMVARLSQQAGFKKSISRLQLMLMGPYFKRRLHSLLAEINRS